MERKMCSPLLRLTNFSSTTVLEMSLNYTAYSLTSPKPTRLLFISYKPPESFCPSSPFSYTLFYSEILDFCFQKCVNPKSSNTTFSTSLMYSFDRPHSGGIRIEYILFIKLSPPPRHASCPKNELQ